MYLHEIVQWAIAKGQAFVSAYPGEAIILFVGGIVSCYVVYISKPR